MNSNTNLNRIGNLLIPNGINFEVNLNFNNSNNEYLIYSNNQNHLPYNYIENDSDNDFDSDNNFDIDSDDEYIENLGGLINNIRNGDFNIDLINNITNLNNDIRSQNISRNNYYNIRSNLDYIRENNRDRINYFNNLNNNQVDQDIDDIEFRSFEEYLNENVQTNPDILNKKLDKLKKYKCKEKVNCTICLEDIPKDTEIYKLKCKHNFHSECLENWLKEKLSCPICRKKI